MEATHKAPGAFDVRPPSRPLRAGVAAGVATAFGAAGHFLVGGASSSPVLIAALLVAAVPAWLLTARERSWGWIAGLQVGTQQVVHAALSVAGPPDPYAALIVHDLAFYAHVLAGLLAAAVLRVGERRLWAAAGRLAERWARWWRLLLAIGRSYLPAPRSPAPVAGRTPWQRGRLLRHVLVLRGPPLPA